MADLNDLKREWDSQPEYPEEKMNEIARLVQTRSGVMRSALFARDMGETIASVIIIVVFGGFWFTAPNAIAKAGIVVTILGCIEAVAVMQIAQRRNRLDFTAVPLQEFLQAEVRMLNRQISLLRHVAWWYLLPLFAGGCLFAIGIGGDREWESGPVFSISFCAAYFVLCTFIWWFNQYGRRKTFEPLRDAMQQTLQGLSEMESDAAAPDPGLVEALTDAKLDSTFPFRLVWPAWHQGVVIAFAGLGGFLGGMQIQEISGEPMRYEEWPLMGLMLAAGFAIGSTCVRRGGSTEPS